MLVSVTTQHRLVRLVFSPSVLQFSLPVSFRSVPPLGPVRLMASLWTQLISTVSLILSLARWVAVSGDSGNVLLFPSRHHEGSRPAMILPLHHSVPESSLSHFNPRRHLQGSQSEHHPNARMRLFDDLLRNGLVSFTPSLPLRPFLFFFFFKLIFHFFVVNYVCFGKLDGVGIIRRGFGSVLLRRGLLLLLIRGALSPMFRALLANTVVATR